MVVERNSMTLSFPNLSRSFDATKNRVRFWGYDGALEILFFVEGEALKKLCPEMSSADAGCLKAFDIARNRIHENADRAYARGHKGSYTCTLAVEDF